jgi:eukaryotic-like serine/threonine-protein kinase
MTAPEGSPVRIGNRYRVEERIGAGAMGAVWRATDELLNRTVAVKELLAVAPGASTEAIEESRQRILREGRIGARLQHAHVISMFDVVVHEDRPWLVMEYLPSDSLAAVLKMKGTLDPVEVADIGRQVADGLSAAHLAGVVHRDVKPGNVLIAPDGRVKLTDFGVSRAVDDVQLTRTGLIAGTPAFLSPEVAQGKDPMAASDVFALGATLYAAVEGSPPFGLDDNAYALLHKVATSAVTPPEQAGPLTGVIMQLLMIEPAERPSAAQARDMLAAVVAGRVVSGPAAPATSVLAAKAPSEPGPSTVTDLQAPAPAPGRRRRRIPVLLAVLLAVLVLGGGALAAVLTNRSATDPGATAVAAPPTTAGTAATSAPATTAARTTTAQPTPTPTSAAPPAATDPVAFVQSYYALLPGNTDAAYAMLGAEARSQSGGRAGFDRFYGGISSVSVENARQVGDGTVTATVRFVKRDGSTSNEAYHFVTSTGSDGRMVMESFGKGGV